MAEPSIYIHPFTLAEWAAVVHLCGEQEGRLHTLDPRLCGASSLNQIREILDQQSSHSALVALDEHERVRGYVQPAIWELPQQSILHAFLTARNGIARTLTLPDPAEKDARAVLSALLFGLTDFWLRKRATGDLIRWPSCEKWLEPVLKEHGFLPDSVCALAPHSFQAPQRPCPPWLSIRPAVSADEEGLLALFLEELEFHTLHTSFVRSSLQALSAFRAKLARLWDEGSLEKGAPMVLVAENEQHHLVAMAELTLVEVEPDEEPGFTSPGWYGCIDNACVQEQARGQGIGRLLTQAAFEMFAPLPLAGVLLWYSLDNPLSSAFWPRMGFVPLWTTYQRQSLTHKSERG